MSGGLDRRQTHAEDRRIAPARLLIDTHCCAVRDIAEDGLRIEPAPADRACVRFFPPIIALSRADPGARSPT